MRKSARRMIGGAVQAICPPGFLCMDTGFVMFVAIVLLSIFVGVWIYRRDDVLSTVAAVTASVSASAAAPASASASAPASASAHARPSVHVAIPYTINQVSSVRAGLPAPPERLYDTQPDFTGMPPPGIPVVPIQVPTRGLPEQFQQMGVLTTPGGSSTSAAPNRTLLPLFGRRNMTGRERYNYYTRTDGYNPVQVPVSFKNRPCDDDNGCDEITTGDTVGVPLLGQTFVATTYRYNSPRYIPLI
jgi:Family of unknown function (DUF5755)